jgi:hypothetical protein
MSFPDFDGNPALTITLSAAVPLHIEEIRDWTPEQRMEKAQGLAGIIAHKGDQLLYGGPDCAETFNALALGLACLAYVPGGVKLFGLEFQAENPNKESAS